MKKILFILLAVVLVCSCKKENKADDVLYANFAYKIEQPLKVIIYDRCEGAWAQYDFGDGERLDVRELGKQMIHKYKSSGSYIITVRAYDGNGNSKEFKRTIQIEKPSIYIKKFMILGVQEEGKYYECSVLYLYDQLEIYTFNETTPKLYSSQLPYSLSVPSIVDVEPSQDYYILRVVQMDNQSYLNKQKVVEIPFNYGLIEKKEYPDGIQTKENGVTAGLVFEYK